LKSHKRILILGAGIAGLSAAWHLRQKGVACPVFEKENEVGGLCRSKRVRGFTFDYSGHLLHFKNPYIFNLVRKLLREQFIKHERDAWVSVDGRYTRYPFQANLFGLPPRIIKECLEGFVCAQKRKREKPIKKPMNFSQWTRRTFGEGIARHFMDPYNTKFWTVPPEEMTCEWLDGMIPVPSLKQVREGARKESLEQLGYNVHFWYPRSGGIERLPQAFAKSLKHIHTGSKISRIDLGKKEIETSSGRREKFDALISTVPLPEMARMIPGLSKDMQATFDRLRWNSIFNLNLGIDLNPDVLKRHWVYFPKKESCFFRVGFPHNFSYDLAPEGKGSLYAEVSYSDRKPINKQKVISHITRDLKKTGLLPPQGKIFAKDVNDIKYGYPIYDRHYKTVREKILGFLHEKGIISCGRYGLWKYMSMEDAILDGKRVAEMLTRA
jgi:protoporphyrinogen oxidase